MTAALGHADRAAPFKSYCAGLLLLAPRKRQFARLSGAKPPSPRAAMALAKSQEYQDAADAPSTLRVYAGDLANFSAWCERHGFTPMPATPEIVGAYLAAAGEGCSMPTLRRLRARHAS